jgi:hypothetical protein
MYGVKSIMLLWSHWGGQRRRDKGISLYSWKTVKENAAGLVSHTLQFTLLTK